jgi:hypothetical protein
VFKTAQTLIDETAMLGMLAHARKQHHDATDHRCNPGTGSVVILSSPDSGLAAIGYGVLVFLLPVMASPWPCWRF